MPLYSVDKCKIRSCIACVQRHDHIGAVAFIVGDIAGKEFQLVVAELPGCHAAEVYDIFFQIETDDLDITLLYEPEVVVEREGQIAFAASEVYDPKSAAVRQLFETAVCDLEIPVDLSEFRIVLFEYFALG